MDSRKLLSACLSASASAGAVLKARFRKKLNIMAKPGAGLVTDADLLAQKRAIQKLWPFRHEWNLIAEEEATQAWPAFDAAKPGTFFLDPLDGTTNFVHGFPMFCVSLGCSWKGDLLFGIVRNPVLDELYIAQRGNGATLNGKSIHVSKTPVLKDALLTTGFGYSTELRDAVLAFERASLQARAIRRPGSAALDLAYTACGVFDGYWERDLKPWDIMAGILLVEEAGGTVTDLTGAKIRPTTPDVLATNGPLQQELLSLVR